MRSGGAELAVTFHGVRGSTPCAGPELVRYGGNTSCVVVEAPDTRPIVLDLGTGLRRYGATLDTDRPFDGLALVTHLHWDHVQGLPFFGPALRAGSRIDVVGPDPGTGASLAEAFDRCYRPPFFPVRLDDLAGTITYRSVGPGSFTEGDVRITVAEVPHTGPTIGFRLDWRGRSIAYVPDHQQPRDGSSTVSAGVTALAHGVDLLIHDAQYTDAEFADRPHWGHSTVGYATTVARTAGVRTLALFHHDPAHDDDTLDALLAEAGAAAAEGGPCVIAAVEGLRCTFDPCDA